ncbi:MAG TPA: riboflavin synthase [Vicinamibacterales bacterium]|jgi:riboflavin synthase|nr:riboflavin synthase [Vicinamibacterales bacterium]
MFTGIIEAIGEVADAQQSAAGMRLRVDTTLAPHLALGDSLAVNGTCLTIVVLHPGAVEMDVSPETLRVTSLGGLATGRLVNLERPMRAGAHVGGHFVQGHVDGTGTLAAVWLEGDSRRMTFTFPAELAPNIVPKGSIAVDGISLTVASVDDARHAPSVRFDVQIIPFTWAHTNLRILTIGDRVNLECDILGKYVLRAVEAFASPVPKTS